MSKPTYMAIDQYGHTYHDLGAHPRKTLLERLARSHADKMYVESKTGDFHAGWIIGGLWLSVYKVEPMREVVR